MTLALLATHPPGGFLTFDPHIPQALLDKAGPQTGLMDIANTVGHFELVNYQLKQVGNDDDGGVDDDDDDES